MKKNLIILSAALIANIICARVKSPVQADHCEFAVHNDSNYNIIYVSTNRTLASEVNQKILNKTKDVAKISNAKQSKPAKIVSNWFYIYIPSEVEGQYVRHFHVKAEQCGQDPKKFKLGYSQIASDNVEDRIIIETVGKATRVMPQAKKILKRKGQTVRATSEEPPTKLERGEIEKQMPSQPEYEVRPGGYDMIIP